MTGDDQVSNCPCCGTKHTRKEFYHAMEISEIRSAYCPSCKTTFHMIVSADELDEFNDAMAVAAGMTSKPGVPPTTGAKADSGKLRHDLVPYDAMNEVIKVLMFGADKYAPHDWAKGRDYHHDFNASKRHMDKWWMGEDKDPASGVSHLAHAACDLLYLLAFEARGMEEFDDRPHNMGRD